MTPEDQIKTLIAYMQLKIELRDWHAVADAAMDLRELEARRSNQSPPDSL